MTLILMTIGCIIVGWAAQSAKGRTGAAWGAITFTVMVLAWFVAYFSTAMVQPDLYQDDSGWYALAVMISVSVTVLMLIIVATLPRKKA